MELRDVLALHNPILEMAKVAYEVDWIFGCHKSLAKVKTNDVYHKLIDRHTWMVEWVNKIGE